MAFSGSQYTRLGLAGISRGLYGSFAGRVENEISTGGGIPPHKRKKYRQDEYERAWDAAKWRKEQREAIQKAVEAEKAEQEGRKPKLRLKVKPEISQAEIEQLAQIQDELDLRLAIEFQLKYLEFKRREDEALAILLLIS